MTKLIENMLLNWLHIVSVLSSTILSPQSTKLERMKAIFYQTFSQVSNLKGTCDYSVR